MKILQRGMLNPDGIELECPKCHCKFIVENRNDMRHERYIGITVNKNIDVTSYSVYCPECNDWVWDFGIDPKKLPGLRSPYEFVFNRPDWKEKFEVEPEDCEVKYFKEIV